MARKIPDETILSAYNETGSTYGAAIKIGCSPSTVWIRLRFMGIELRRKQNQDNEKRNLRAVELRKDGHSLSDIGRALSIGREHARQILSKAELRGVWDGQFTPRLRVDTIAGDPKTERVGQMYRAGAKMSEIAQELYLSKNQITSRLKFLNIKPDNRDYGNLKVSNQEIIESWLRRKSIMGVSREVNLSVAATSTRLHKLGLRKTSKRASPVTDQEVRHALREFGTLEFAAKHLNYNEIALAIRCRKMGIKLPDGRRAESKHIH